MRISQMLSIFNGLFLSCNVAAATLLSPYVDRTFNTNHLGGSALWSLNRDKPSADKWGSPTCSGTNLQQQNYEFVDHLTIPQ